MRSLLVILIYTATCCGLSAGRVSAQAPLAQNNAFETSGRVNETIILDTTDKRIIETDYRAATAIKSDASANRRGIYLNVGASVVADRINVHLQNVTGRVRFVSTTDKLNQNVGLERAKSTGDSLP